MRTFMTGKRLTIRADEEMLRTIERRQEETGASVSEIVRRAVRKAYAEPAPIETRDNEVAANLRRAGFLLTPRGETR
jgi:metal-responsive CopG/Arc/MetJ family transcriptional regulator